MSGWIDISQFLDEGVPVWPGDTPFSYRLTWTKEESGSVNVGQVAMSTHTGTHIDAPFHFDEEGKRVGELDLAVYAGPAKVLDREGIGWIGPETLAGEEITGVERILIRTGAWKDRSRFPKAIPPVDPALAPWLKQRGIRLLGLDLPSVDPLDSKDLPAHHALARHGVHILEGVVLDEVQAGTYELVAFPLPLKQADGSPVRAALRPL
ncbi:arylformamidase [Desmospora profundinema]|uniref:Kynurenine formamidase n=1 Tax=Desmospora profundinema TaxID=1571184 RepID=A0ABU1IJ30_9BACL|nr:arylformamidase [Desmospora profundinema]MDR6224169.1 arylformamidase [Desmospora profundinema]